MNLRDNYLPLSGAIREENLEALFNVKEVSTKYRQIVQSEEFSQELCEQHNALVKLVDELSQEVGRDSRYDQIASKEDLMELVRTNVILNAIGNVLDSIIFDGRPASSRSSRWNRCGICCLETRMPWSMSGRNSSVSWRRRRCSRDAGSILRLASSGDLTGS